MKKIYQSDTMRWQQLSAQDIQAARDLLDQIEQIEAAFMQAEQDQDLESQAADLAAEAIFRAQVSSRGH